MKRLYICIFVLVAALSCWATGQQGDIIYIDGERMSLLGEPIARDSTLSRRVREILPEVRTFTSSNWDGFIAFWSIRNDMLCLDSVQVQFCNRETGLLTGQSLPDDNIRRVFKDYIVDGDIVATWFTGKIRVGKGDVIRYVHMGYDRNLEYEQILTITQGKVTDRVSYHNTVAVDGFSFNDIHNSEDSHRMIPFPVENYPELDPETLGSSCFKIYFDVYGIQVDSLGNLVDCKVRVLGIKGMETDDDLKERMAHDMKAALMSIRPWRVLLINGDYYVNDSKRYSFPYTIEK